MKAISSDPCRGHRLRDQKQMERKRRRQLHHLPPMIKENPELGTQESMETGLKYWKSLDALAETPGFNEWIQDEFLKELVFCRVSRGEAS